VPPADFHISFETPRYPKSAHSYNWRDVIEEVLVGGPCVRKPVHSSGTIQVGVEPTIVVSKLIVVPIFIVIRWLLIFLVEFFIWLLIFQLLGIEEERGEG
jgi:hypothetical protein